MFRRLANFYRNLSKAREGHEKSADHANMQFPSDDARQLAKLLDTPYSYHDFDNLWETFIFLESEGLDVAVLQRSISSRIKMSFEDDETYFFAREIGPDEEKALVYQLRQSVREATGMSPLKYQDRDEWTYFTPPSNLDWARFQIDEPEWKPNDDDVRDAVLALQQRMPNAMPAYLSIKKENLVRTKTVGQIELGQRWISKELNYAIKESKPDSTTSRILAIIDRFEDYENPLELLARER